MQYPRKLALLTLLAIGAAPGGAAAEHRRDGGWTQLGDVGTHRQDAEDFLPVRRQRLDALQLRARGRAVALDHVRIRFTDGSSHLVDVGGWIRPGQPVTIELPDARSPVEMLVLDYGNAGPHARARETAHVQVLGHIDDGAYRFRAPPERIVQPTAAFAIRGGVRVRIR